MNLESASVLVEASIRGLNVDPALCRGEKAGQWSLKIKDANIWIDVFNFATTPDKWYLQVMSPLFKMPEKNVEGVALDLLELGYNMYTCGIVKKDNWFYILGLRPANDLNQGEIDYMIDKVAFYSSDFYSKMTFKYSGSWPPAPPVNTGGDRAN